jgi:hypothetical protein
MLGKTGFRLHKRDAWGGFIRCRVGWKFRKIKWVIAGPAVVSILVVPVDLRRWDFPWMIRIPIDEQVAMLQNLRLWSRKQGLRTDIDALCAEWALGEKDNHALESIGPDFCSSSWYERMLKK